MELEDFIEMIANSHVQDESAEYLPPLHSYTPFPCLNLNCPYVSWYITDVYE
jgi:hypothetical protein